VLFGYLPLNLRNLARSFGSLRGDLGPELGDAGPFSLACRTALVTTSACAGVKSASVSDRATAWVSSIGSSPEALSSDALCGVGGDRRSRPLPGGELGAVKVIGLPTLSRRRYRPFSPA